MNIHHVGYLTSNIDRSLAEFIRLGYSVEHDTELDGIRKIRIAFLTNGGYRVELIEPLDADSPMAPLLKRYKNTPYHICYETDDLDAEIDRLGKNGYTVFQAPQIAPCIDGRRVAFLLHRDIGIIELVECIQH